MSENLVSALRDTAKIASLPGFVRDESTQSTDEIDRLRMENEALKGQLHEEIAANLAFRKKGGALADEDMPTFCDRLIAERKQFHAETEDLKALVNAPEVEAFLRGCHIEAVHQVERWGTAHDRAKRPADWFWLVGYLAGKALHAAAAGDIEKAKHHTISTAAALYNWHCAISGTDVRMCPGRSDLAEVVESIYPGETA